MRSTMVPTEICVTGAGMVSSLGFDAVTCCAAARAGLSRLEELRVLNFIEDQIWGGKSVTGHSVPRVGMGFVGIGKALLLGRLALKDLLEGKGVSTENWQRTAFYLNVSDQFLTDADAIDERRYKAEIMAKYAADDSGEAEEEAYEDRAKDDHPENSPLPSEAWRADCEHLVSRLLGSVDISISCSNQHVYFGSHAEIAAIVQQAVRGIDLGLFDRCIVGGIDSCIEPRFLIAAARKGTLKTGAHPVGFVPGEAAAFILLERLSDLRRLGIQSALVIRSVSSCGEEQGRLSDEPPQGVALAQAIDEALSSLVNSTPIGLIIADLNGDDYRASDWGSALVRLQAKYKLGELPTWFPAAAFGETGAAAGLVAICVAARALARRYAPDAGILLPLSSDNGLRGCLCLEQFSSHN